MMAGGISDYTNIADIEDDNLGEPVLPHVKPRVLIVVADGSDELEVLALSDALARGDLHVTLGAVGKPKRNIVTGSFGLRIQAEKSIEECSFDTYDLIVVPGGSGVSHVRDSDLVIKMLLWQKQDGRLFAASSSAPAVVLRSHGLLGGRATCTAAFEREMTQEYVDEDVVVDHHCVTSQGSGTVLKFALTLIQLLNGPLAARKAANELLYAWP